MWGAVPILNEQVSKGKPLKNVHNIYDRFCNDGKLSRTGTIQRILVQEKATCDFKYRSKTDALDLEDKYYEKAISWAKQVFNGLRELHDLRLCLHVTDTRVVGFVDETMETLKLLGAEYATVIDPAGYTVTSLGPFNYGVPEEKT